MLCWSVTTDEVRASEIYLERMRASALRLQLRAGGVALRCAGSFVFRKHASNERNEKKCPRGEHSSDQRKERCTFVANEATCADLKISKNERMNGWMDG